MRPRYMIHTSPAREWYVHEYLIPAMTAQGIPRRHIRVWLDADGQGNLHATMASFRFLGKRLGGVTWHLQDDVLISHCFAAVTEQELLDQNLAVICGFCPDFTYDDHPREQYTGWTTPDKLWWSFPCIRIPNWLAKECATWFDKSEGHFNDSRLEFLYREGKGDDSFFSAFLEEKYRYVAPVFNCNPNLVQHVDDMLGGSLVNPERKETIRSKYWVEQGETEELMRFLDRRKHEKENG